MCEASQVAHHSLVSILKVVATAAPHPVAVQVPRPGRATAAAGRQAAVAAGARDRQRHPCRCDGVRERCFSGRCNQGCMD